jgi:hypothetical protein
VALRVLLKPWHLLQTKGKEKRMSFLKKYCSNLVKDPDDPKIKLPFGLRLGGVIDITTPFFIFNVGNTVMKDPGAKLYIEAISRYDRPDCNIYNLYVGSMDGNDYILQVDFDTDFILQAAKLFQQTYEIFPQTAEELQEWEGKLIGDEYIKLPDGIEYDREWEPERRGHLSGYKLNERLYSESFDSYNELHRLMMLYGRVINDEKEYLLVSSIRSPGKNFIDIMVGINLNHEGVKFN